MGAGEGEERYECRCGGRGEVKGGGGEVREGGGGGKGRKQGTGERKVGERRGERGFTLSLTIRAVGAVVRQIGVDADRP